MDQRYEVVTSYDLIDLMDTVTAAMNNGWQPQGGIAVNENGKLFQAITFRPKRESTQRTPGPVVSFG